MAESTAPSIDEFTPLREGHTHTRLNRFFSSRNSVEWAWRKHRAEYIAGKAAYEIAGRVVIHPERFERVTLEIGARTLEQRQSTRR